VFWRALEGGQFDDLERPAHDVLMDDDRTESGSDPDLR
jgi:cbb3-type cytochrome oxidase maturation protein